MSDYLWDGQGSDPATERLEELLRPHATTVLAPPFERQRHGLDRPGPRWLVAAAALLLLGLGVLWMVDGPGPEPILQQALRSAPPADPVHVVSSPASIPMEPGELTGDVIAAMSLDAASVWNSVRNLSLLIEDKTGDVRERRVVVTSKHDSDGRRRYAIFTGPHDVAGVQLLTIDRGTHADDMWLYMPGGGGMLTRISGSSKRGSFMGTDFRFEDLCAGWLAEVTTELLGEEGIEVGGESVDAWRLLTPHSRGAASGHGSSYSRVETWVSQDDFLPRQVHFYDRHDELERILTIPTVDEDSGLVVPMSFVMENVKRGTRTEVLVKDHRLFDDPAELPDAMFTPEFLQPELSLAGSWPRPQSSDPIVLMDEALGPPPGQGDDWIRPNTVTIYPAVDGNVHFPQLSPDRATLAFEVNVPADKRTTLWTAPWNDGALDGPATELVPPSPVVSLEGDRYRAGKRIIHGLSWAPSGPFGYAYSLSDSQGTQDIYIDGWSQLVGSLGSANKNPTWDPAGGRFVFSSGRTGNGDLYLWDGDAGGVELQLTFDDKNGELYPSFNHAGDKVAFVRAGRDGSHIMVLDVNMFTVLALVQWDGGDSTRPVFSPDDTRLAFFSNKGTDSVQEFGLWVTDSLPGGTPRNIAPRVKVPSKGTAYWTPDGKYLLAALDNPDARDPLCFLPVEGGSARCLAGADARTFRDPFLVVSEGKWLVIATARGPGSRWQSLVVFEMDPLP